MNCKCVNTLNEGMREVLINRDVGRHTPRPSRTILCRQKGCKVVVREGQTVPRVFLFNESNVL